MEINEQCEILLGNSLEILLSLPTESFDMIFADPPYNLSNNGFTCQNGRAVSVNKGIWDKSQGVEQDFEFHRKWLAACQRLLKPNGTIWVTGTHHSILMCGFALQILGYHIINDVAWFKPNASPNLSCRCFTASHEMLLWARKSQKGKHIFNYQVMKDGVFPKDFLKKPGKQMRSIWAISTSPPSEKKYGKHPTQKPLKLLERIVLASTHPNNSILDPFMGSGTTGIAALKHGRRFVGIEREKDYFDLAEKRIREVLSQPEISL
jgi:site-specific DNA-methyltransferase (adenine-specific)